MNVLRWMPVLSRLYSSKNVLFHSSRHLQRRQIVARYGKSSHLAVDLRKNAPREPSIESTEEPSQVPSSPDLQSGFNESAAIAELIKCGRSPHHTSLEARRKSLRSKWEELWQRKDELSIDIYNTYIQVCIENEQALDYKQILEMVTRAKPTQQTFILLLKLASQMGDVTEAVDILMRMKTMQIPVDESVFNALIIGYTMHKGLEGADYVLGTMKVAQIPVSKRTNWAILNGLIRHGKRNEFRQFLEIIPKLKQEDKEYVELLHVAAVQGRHLWLEDVLGDFDWESKTRAFVNSIEDTCMDLVHCGCPDAAIYYYATFVDVMPNRPYGKHLLREMLNSFMSRDHVIAATKHLQKKHPLALFDLAHIMLQRSMVEETYKVFEALPFVRPHFFWPIFRAEGRARGEYGVFQVLQKMDQLNVKPDYTTLEQYVLKYYHLGEAQAVMESLAQVPNLMHRDLLSPIIALLLKDGRTMEAKILCQNSHKIPIVGEHLLKHVVNCWTSSGSCHIVPILTKICETNTPGTDWVGAFLMDCFRTCSNSQACSRLLELLKAIDREGLKITSAMYDGIVQHVINTDVLRRHKSDLEEHLERLLDITKADNSRFIHPKDMKVDELEQHLSELEHKGMETRGVLRKLMMAHARIANHKRVLELRQIMQMRKYDESAGMKSALFHSFVLGGDLRHAKLIFEEIKNSFASFKIDTFKLIDFAALLVRNGAVDEAMSLLSREAGYSKADGSMERNCWILLGSAQKPEDTFRLFQLLVEKKFCKPTNVILGPILRPFVNASMVDKLVDKFCECCEMYNVTPLQLEVLCMVLETKDDAMLQRVVNAIGKVHGREGARFGLISALAEKGLEKPILKLLLDRAQLRAGDLQKRIDRWVIEGKIKPIQTLEAANRRLTVGVFDNMVTSSAIMKIYCNRNDFAAAIGFWRQLEDNDGKLSKECMRQLTRLLKTHNISIPESLQHAMH